MSKKISVGLAVAIAALAAAIAFFAGHMVTQGKVNDTLIDLNEKQVMYSKLYELDQCVRTNKGDFEIDEKSLMEGICRGYIDGLSDSAFSYVTAEELDENAAADDSLSVIKLSDGSAVIINLEALQNGGETDEPSSEQTDSE